MTTKTNRKELMINDMVAFNGENENADKVYFGQIVLFGQLAVLIRRLDENTKKPTICRDGKQTQFWVNFWELKSVTIIN